jgi:hypothetical protein
VGQVGNLPLVFDLLAGCQAAPLHFRKWFDARVSAFSVDRSEGLQKNLFCQGSTRAERSHRARV